MNERPLWRRALRASMIALAVVIVLVLAMVSRARAEAEAELWHLGQSLASVGEHMDASGDPRTLIVNGAEVVIRSQRVDGDVAQALDGAEAACEGFEVGERSTTLRSENADHGFVACFLELGRLELDDLWSAGWAFIADGNLSALGAFDYTYARAGERGVHQLRVRIPRLDIAAMFPDSGDAPGLDVAGVPRPPGGQRLLSAFNIDEPYQIAIYRSEQGTPEQIAAGYRHQMAADGWDVRVGQAAPSRVTMAAFRGSAMVAVVVRAGEGAITTTIAAGL